jgi:hypothetical protein
MMSKSLRCRKGTGAGVLATLVALAWAGIVGSAAAQGGPDTLTALRDRPAEDEVIYFLLPDRFANGDPSNDRGGMSGDRLVTGWQEVMRMPV